MSTIGAELTARMGRLDRRAAAAIVLLTGVAVTALSAVALGLLAVAVHQSLDAPLYDELVRNYAPGSAFTAFNETFTEIGDVNPSFWQAIVAAIVLAVFFGRRWWIPVALLPVGFVLEYGLQVVVANIIDRGHPYLGMGLYFSGGTARVVVIYGLILFLILLRWPGISRRWRMVGIAIVAALSFTEGFTRLYLLYHWPTDVAGGFLVGTFILGTLILATNTLVGGKSHRQ
jgi:membrane-associated phospholipid phosphatase